MLCSPTNRFLLQGSPTTCALDTSITPFPSFLLLAFILIYISYALLRGSKSFSYSSASAWPHAESPRFVLPKWVEYTYVALVVCLLAMRVLEVARLGAAQMGLGLLPVGVLASLIVILMLTVGRGGIGMGRERGLVVSASLVFYWALSTVLLSVKVARLSTYNELHPAKGTNYPSSDYLLDNGVMLGLLVIFFFTEGTYLVLRWRSTTLGGAQAPVREKGISRPKQMDEFDSVV